MTDIAKQTCLIVDDDLLITRYLTIMVEHFGYQVCATARTADDAVQLAYDHLPDVILMDVRLIGEADGVDAAIRINSQNPIKTIFVTGSNEPPTMARIRNDHPHDILIKPVEPGRLYRALAD